MYFISYLILHPVSYLIVWISRYLQRYCAPISQAITHAKHSQIFILDWRFIDPQDTSHNNIGHDFVYDIIPNIVTKIVSNMWYHEVVDTWYVLLVSNSIQTNDTDSQTKVLTMLTNFFLAFTVRIFFKFWLQYKTIQNT